MVSHEISAFDVEGPTRGDWSALDTLILLVTTLAYQGLLAFACGSLAMTRGTEPVSDPKVWRISWR
jgi:hypothetical protein